jgi:hypothetical protein
MRGGPQQGSVQRYLAMMKHAIASKCFEDFPPISRACYKLHTKKQKTALSVVIAMVWLW